MQSNGSTLFRAAGRSALVSSAVSAIGVVSLVLLYVGFLANVESLLIFGPINDALIIVQYALAVPVAVAMHRILKPRSPKPSLVGMLVAFVGIGGVIVFQLLLLTGVMSFSEQFVYASTFLLVIGVWIVITGFVGRGSGKFGFGIPTIVLGASYLGFPFWIYRVGRYLLTHDQTTGSSSSVSV